MGLVDAKAILAFLAGPEKLPKVYDLMLPGNHRRTVGVHLAVHFREVSSMIALYEAIMLCRPDATLFG